MQACVDKANKLLSLTQMHVLFCKSIRIDPHTVIVDPTAMFLHPFPPSRHDSHDVSEYCFQRTTRSRHDRQKFVVHGGPDWWAWVWLLPVSCHLTTSLPSLYLESNQSGPRLLWSLYYNVELFEVNQSEVVSLDLPAGIHMTSDPDGTIAFEKAMKEVCVVGHFFHLEVSA